MTRAAIMLAIIIGLLAPGCAGTYRTRTVMTAGVAMVWDPGYRVYVVESYPNVYYSGGIYYRFSSGGWESGRKVDGPWRPCKKHRLPPGLRKKM